MDLAYCVLRWHYYRVDFYNVIGNFQKKTKLLKNDNNFMFYINNNFNIFLLMRIERPATGMMMMHNLLPHIDHGHILRLIVEPHLRSHPPAADRRKLNAHRTRIGMHIAIDGNRSHHDDRIAAVRPDVRIERPAIVKVAEHQREIAPGAHMTGGPAQQLRRQRSAGMDKCARHQIDGRRVAGRPPGAVQIEATRADG